jgi:hypothetical protein
MPLGLLSRTAAETTACRPRRGDAPACSPAGGAAARQPHHDARHAPDAERNHLPPGIARGHRCVFPGQGAGADSPSPAALALPAKACVSNLDR